MATQITVADSADWDFGTAPWTAEIQFRTSATISTARVLIGQYDDATQDSWQIRLNVSGDLEFRYSTDGTTWITQTSSPVFKPTANQFHHIAVERDRDHGIAVSADGVLRITFTVADELEFFKSSATLKIGAGFTDDAWIDEVRLTKGLARYSGKAFTAPTAAFPDTLGAAVDCGVTATNDPDFASVVLLVTCNGTHRSRVFNDLSNSAHPMTAKAQAKIDGFDGISGSALALDGWNDYIHTNDTPADWAFGTADFTVEFWVKVRTPKRVGLVGYSVVDDVGSPARKLGHWGVDLTLAGLITFDVIDSGIILTATTDINVAGWVHVAVDRESGTTRLYIQGTEEATSAAVYDIVALTLVGVIIGAQPGDTLNQSLDGWMDEIRITKGVARFRGVDFTPSTAAYFTS